MDRHRLIVVTDDDVTTSKIRLVGDALAAFVRSVGAVGEALDEDEPFAIVVDLRMDGAIAAAARLRRRWPDALIAGFVSLPDPVVWREALDAGYNLVATRGTVATQVRTALETWNGPPSATRFPLFDVADITGRLGVVARMTETPFGPIAVYQIGHRLFAACDTCPHAGARLSEGELSGTVVTCPRHGSRFDLTTGERVRGPADEKIPIHDVIVDGGVAYLEY
jgi:nitrite reductase/ring-hydroxylating ferredoxin subunit